MFKIFNYLLIILFFIGNNQVSALNSSSYLITNSAISMLDFDEAYLLLDYSNENLNEYDLHNQLLTLINLNYLDKANKVSKQILELNKENQEAWIVRLTFAKINNIKSPFVNYQQISKKLNMEFLNFIFFNHNGDIKNKTKIAQSIFEIVVASISENNENKNFKFLLFYLSIMNILNPNFDEGYYYKAKIYELSKNYSKAEFFYNQIDINHNLFMESQINNALNKRKQGFFLEGEKSLKKLIKIYDNNKILLTSLADLYRLEKKYNKAIEFYTKSIKINVKSIDIDWRLFYLRGICFERSSNWEMAEKDFINSLKINPDSPEVLNYLAYGWLERNIKLNEATKMLKQAYKANPDSYYIADSLAWAYYKKKEYKKAVNLMEKVIVMAPGEAISLFHLGDIYYAMNRKREASFFWKQALDLAEPEDLITKELLEKLEMYNAG